MQRIASTRFPELRLHKQDPLWLTALGITSSRITACCMASQWQLISTHLTIETTALPDPSPFEMNCLRRTLSIGFNSFSKTSGHLLKMYMRELILRTTTSSR